MKGAWAVPLLCAEDYRAVARERVEPQFWDYIEGGSGAELTLSANQRLFDTIQLRPRMLVDVSTCDTSTTLLGNRLAAPIVIAPTAYHQMAHPEGEVATARGAGVNATPYVVSMFATRTLEDVAAATNAPLWMQLYWLRDRDAVASLAGRARKAGYQAIVLTVDAPELGVRRRDVRNALVIPPDMRAANLDASHNTATHEHAEGQSAVAAHAARTFDRTITWSDLAWLREVSELPIVVKGVLTGEDAAAAVAHGVDVIVVSNHGGRQLDGAVPSLAALPEIVAAVDGRCPVLLDGSVRTGRDIFVALGLGADAVLLGRPVLWALAADGADGVASLVAMLSAELAHVMTLAGRPRLADIGPDALAWPGPVSPAWPGRSTWS